MARVKIDKGRVRDRDGDRHYQARMRRSTSGSGGGWVGGFRLRGSLDVYSDTDEVADESPRGVECGVVESIPSGSEYGYLA